MRCPVIVIHGAGAPRERSGKVYWEPLLKADLGDGYSVTAPRMPDPEDPQYGAWAARIKELLDEHERPALVGHSFGASVILKYLSEASSPPKLRGLFLIATPWWGPKFPEFALPKNFAERVSSLCPIHFYHSKDDPEIPLAHLTHYRQALPNATVRLLDGRGHEFDQASFPELVADIKHAVGR